MKVSVQNRAAKILATLLIGVGIAATASADITWNYGSVYSGGSPPDPVPWLISTVHDVTPGTVTLTIQANLQTTVSPFNTGTFVSDVGFNYNGDSTKLTFTKQGTSGTFADPSVGTTTAANEFSFDGGGYYNIMLAFDTSSGGTTATRFDNSDSITYTITSAGLTAADFNVLARPHGGNGVYYTAAHVQGYTVNGGSAWVSGVGAVPEPTTMIAGALLLLPFGASTIRFIRKNRAA